MSDTFAPSEPQRSLHEVLPGVYCLHGSVVFKPMVRLSRTMVVLKEGDALTVVNSVRPNDSNLAALEALGTVENVVKIGIHGMDDPWYLDRYDAEMWALPGVDPEGLKVTRRLGEQSLLPWVRSFSFQDTKQPEGALVVDRGPGLLVTCDSVQNWTDTEGCSLAAKAVVTAMGFTKYTPNIGPPWRKAMTKEGGSLQADFERLLEEPFDAIIGGHGKPMVSGAKAALAATVAATFG